MNNLRIMIVGPTPPLMGGIATYVSNMLNSNLNKKCDLILYSTNRPSKNNIPSSDSYKAVFDVSFCHLLKCISITLYHILKFPLVLLKTKPNIIHIHTSSYLTFLENSIYVLSSKILKKKVILHVHSGEFDLFYRNSSSFMKLFIKRIMLVPNQIISLSTYWEEFFIYEIGLEKKNILTLYNGYDSSKFYPMDSKKCRSHLGLPNDKVIILTVGNLLEVKGHKYLIEAMSKIIKNRNDIISIIVGEGILQDKLEKQIATSGLMNYVKIVGKKPYETIPLWMNASNLFVLPSLKEGNPMVMLEALGVGLPFVGTKVGAIPEIIASDDYGLLANPKDVTDLSKRILLALEKKWDCTKIINYSNQFEWNNISIEILNLYLRMTKQ